MEWISTYIGSYVNDLISNEWVDWSEQVLNQQHDEKYSTPRGFQEFIGSTGADPRTRAGELFRLGLLRGLLVNEKGGSRNSIPYGWDLIQHNQHVHTRIGYLAYWIGKAIREKAVTPKIRKAFEVLCTVFALQSGFKFGDDYILLATLYNYLLDNFVPSAYRESQKWQRYLAAAMFCTLHSTDAEISSLVIPYIKEQPVEALFLRFQDGTILKVTPDELASKMDEGMSIDGNLSPRKASLYWIGEHNELRGIYSKAVLQGSGCPVSGILDRERRERRHSGKSEEIDEPEKAVYARVQGQSGAGKLPTGYHD